MSRTKEALEKATLKARADALKKLPQTSTPADLGQGLKNGGGKEQLKARVQALDTLRLRSPDLPEDLLTIWPRLAKTWTEAVGKSKGATVGKVLVTRLSAVKAALGSFYLSGKKASAKPGDPDAFKTFVLQMQAECPAPASVLTL